MVKRDNINYFAVGLFVLTMLALLFYALLRLGGNNEKADVYYTVFKNVSGIKPGASVAFQGFELGNVHAIEPLQKDGATSYRLALRLKQGWKVPDDSRAVISASGLLSGSLVEIRGGKSAALIAPGGTIAATDSGNLFEAMATLTEQLSDIASTDAKPLIANLNKRVDKIGVALEKSVPESMNQLQSVLKKLDNTASALEVMLNAENRKHVSSVLKNADQSSVNIAKLSSDIQQTRKQLDSLLADTQGIVTQNRPDLEASVVELRTSLQRVNSIMHHLEAASRNTNEFTRVVRQNPSLLIQSTPVVDQNEGNK
jgi:phospholipid/cholesterol/gamma-HCH transport system substrate-binding protein